MSKAYPSNLTLEQYEMLSDLIPEPKRGGRPRTVDMWEVLNAIFYVLVEGVRWRALPGDFPAWQTVYTYFRNWRKDGTWITMHDSLREWVRIEQGRDPHPSEASIDSQSVKTAAGVHEAVGYVGAACAVARSGQANQGTQALYNGGHLGITDGCSGHGCQCGGARRGKTTPANGQTKGQSTLAATYDLGGWRL